jgi:hypothetical protein
MSISFEPRIFALAFWRSQFCFEVHLKALTDPAASVANYCERHSITNSGVFYTGGARLRPCRSARTFHYNID